MDIKQSPTLLRVCAHVYLLFFPFLRFIKASYLYLSNLCLLHVLIPPQQSSIYFTGMFQICTTHVLFHLASMYNTYTSFVIHLHRNHTIQRGCSSKEKRSRKYWGELIWSTCYLSHYGDYIIVGSPLEMKHKDRKTEHIELITISLSLTNTTAFILFQFVTQTQIFTSLPTSTLSSLHCSLKNKCWNFLYTPIFLIQHCNIPYV